MHVIPVIQELTNKHNAELEALQKEKDSIQAEYERVKSELSSRLKAAEDEVGNILTPLIQSTILRSGHAPVIGCAFFKEQILDFLLTQHF